MTPVGFLTRSREYSIPAFVGTAALLPASAEVGTGAFCQLVG